MKIKPISLNFHVQTKVMLIRKLFIIGTLDGRVFPKPTLVFHLQICRLRKDTTFYASLAFAQS